MGLFKHLREKITEHKPTSSPTTPDQPPTWAPAPELSHALGKLSDAPEHEFEAGEDFCRLYPPNPPALLPPSVVNRIKIFGGGAWGVSQPGIRRFSGTILNGIKGGPGVTKVKTTPSCGDVSLFSDIPILAGLYGTHGKTGVYYEVLIHQMDGIIAVGTACHPYPEYRLPGWNRLSAGLHLDDMRKFFEDPNGGRDYITDPTQVRPGDTIGCGYEFATGSLFYTYNGYRLPPAFVGIYMPRQSFDVFAAIGVEGKCDFDVNFGGDYFKWKEGNEWSWRAEGHVGGDIVGGAQEVDDELPAYSGRIAL